MASLSEDERLARKSYVKSVGRKPKRTEKRDALKGTRQYTYREVS
jgi:hypothetical protein